MSLLLVTQLAVNVLSVRENALNPLSKSVGQLKPFPAKMVDYRIKDVLTEYL
ncbi:hypothetical protein IFO70_27690 [Phormidium tenue FACHB-886]|nr:hypothetical protein [Phormidium tenue FACHB-886]